MCGGGERIDVLVDKSTCSSWIRPEFGFQYPQSSSELSVTTVQGNPMFSLGLHAHQACT